MSYLNKKERIFKYGEPFNLVHSRSEFRMKKYWSATDRRAWCDDVEQRRQHFLEWIAFNKGQFCLENYIPMDLIFDAMASSRDNEVEMLKRRIEYLEALLDVYKQIDLTPEQQNKVDALNKKLAKEKQKLKDAEEADRPEDKRKKKRRKSVTDQTKPRTASEDPRELQKDKRRRTKSAPSKYAPASTRPKDVSERKRPRSRDDGSLAPESAATRGPKAAKKDQRPLTDTETGEERKPRGRGRLRPSDVADSDRKRPRVGVEGERTKDGRAAKKDQRPPGDAEPKKEDQPRGRGRQRPPTGDDDSKRTRVGVEGKVVPGPKVAKKDQRYPREKETRRESMPRVWERPRPSDDADPYGKRPRVGDDAKVVPEDTRRKDVERDQRSPRDVETSKETKPEGKEKLRPTDDAIAGAKRPRVGDDEKVIPDRAGKPAKKDQISPGRGKEKPIKDSDADMKRQPMREDGITPRDASIKEAPKIAESKPRGRGRLGPFDDVPADAKRPGIRSDDKDGPLEKKRQQDKGGDKGTTKRPKGTTPDQDDLKKKDTAVPRLPSARDVEDTKDTAGRKKPDEDDKRPKVGTAKKKTGVIDEREPIDTAEKRHPGTVDGKEPSDITKEKKAGSREKASKDTAGPRPPSAKEIDDTKATAERKKPDVDEKRSKVDTAKGKPGVMDDKPSRDTAERKKPDVDDKRSKVDTARKKPGVIDDKPSRDTAERRGQGPVDGKEPSDFTKGKKAGPTEKALKDTAGQRPPSAKDIDDTEGTVERKKPDDKRSKVETAKKKPGITDDKPSSDTAEKRGKVEGKEPSDIKKKKKAGSTEKVLIDAAAPRPPDDRDIEDTKGPVEEKKPDVDDRRPKVDKAKRTPTAIDDTAGKRVPSAMDGKKPTDSTKEKKVEPREKVSRGAAEEKKPSALDEKDQKDATGKGRPDGVVERGAKDAADRGKPGAVDKKWPEDAVKKKKPDTVVDKQKPEKGVAIKKDGTAAIPDRERETTGAGIPIRKEKPEETIDSKDKGDKPVGIESAPEAAARGRGRGRSRGLLPDDAPKAEPGREPAKKLDSEGERKWPGRDTGPEDEGKRPVDVRARMPEASKEEEATLKARGKGRGRGVSRTAVVKPGEPGLEGPGAEKPETKDVKKQKPGPAMSRDVIPDRVEGKPLEKTPMDDSRPAITRGRGRTRPVDTDSTKPGKLPDILKQVPIEDAREAEKEPEPRGRGRGIVKDDSKPDREIVKGGARVIKKDGKADGPGLVGDRPQERKKFPEEVAAREKPSDEAAKRKRAPLVEDSKTGEPALDEKRKIPEKGRDLKVREPALVEKRKVPEKERDLKTGKPALDDQRKIPEKERDSKTEPALDDRRKIPERGKDLRTGEPALGDKTKIPEKGKDLKTSEPSLDEKRKIPEKGGDLKSGESSLDKRRKIPEKGLDLKTVKPSPDDKRKIPERERDLKTGEPLLDDKRKIPEKGRDLKTGEPLLDDKRKMPEKGRDFKDGITSVEDERRIPEKERDVRTGEPFVDDKRKISEKAKGLKIGEPSPDDKRKIPEKERDLKTGEPLLDDKRKILEKERDSKTGVPPLDDKRKISEKARDLKTGEPLLDDKRKMPEKGRDFKDGIPSLDDKKRIPEKEKDVRTGEPLLDDKRRIPAEERDFKTGQPLYDDKRKIQEKEMGLKTGESALDDKKGVLEKGRELKPGEPSLYDKRKIPVEAGKAPPTPAEKPALRKEIDSVPETKDIRKEKRGPTVPREVIPGLEEGERFGKSPVDDSRPARVAGRGRRRTVDTDGSKPGKPLDVSQPKPTEDAGVISDRDLKQEPKPRGRGRRMVEDDSLAGREMKGGPGVTKDGRSEKPGYVEERPEGKKKYPGEVPGRRRAMESTDEPGRPKEDLTTGSPVLDDKGKILEERKVSSKRPEDGRRIRRPSSGIGTREGARDRIDSIPDSSRRTSEECAANKAAAAIAAAAAAEKSPKEEQLPEAKDIIKKKRGPPRRESAPGVKEERFRKTPVDDEAAEKFPRRKSDRKPELVELEVFVDKDGVRRVRKRSTDGKPGRPHTDEDQGKKKEAEAKKGEREPIEERLGDEDKDRKMKIGKPEQKGAPGKDLSDREKAQIMDKLPSGKKPSKIPEDIKAKEADEIPSGELSPQEQAKILPEIKPEEPSERVFERAEKERAPIMDKRPRESPSGFSGKEVAPEEEAKTMDKMGPREPLERRVKDKPIDETGALEKKPAEDAKDELRSKKRPPGILKDIDTGEDQKIKTPKEIPLEMLSAEEKAEVPTEVIPSEPTGRRDKGKPLEEKGVPEKKFTEGDKARILQKIKPEEPTERKVRDKPVKEIDAPAKKVKEDEKAKTPEALSTEERSSGFPEEVEYFVDGQQGEDGRPGSVPTEEEQAETPQKIEYIKPSKVRAKEPLEKMTVPEKGLAEEEKAMIPMKLSKGEQPSGLPKDIEYFVDEDGQLRMRQRSEDDGPGRVIPEEEQPKIPHEIAPIRVREPLEVKAPPEKIPTEEVEAKTAHKIEPIKPSEVEAKEPLEVMAAPEKIPTDEKIAKIAHEMEPIKPSEVGVKEPLEVMAAPEKIPTEEEKAKIPHKIESFEPSEVGVKKPLEKGALSEKQLTKEEKVKILKKLPSGEQPIGLPEDIEYFVDENGQPKMRQRGVDGQPARDLTEEEQAKILEQLPVEEKPSGLPEGIEYFVDEDGQLKMRERGEEERPGRELTAEEQAKILQKIEVRKPSEVRVKVEPIEEKGEKLTEDEKAEILRRLSIGEQPAGLPEEIEYFVDEDGEPKMRQRGEDGLPGRDLSEEEQAKIIEELKSIEKPDIEDIEYSVDEDGNIKISKRGVDGAPAKELTDSEKAILLEKLKAGERPSGFEEVEDDTWKKLAEQLEKEPPEKELEKKPCSGVCRHPRDKRDMKPPDEAEKIMETPSSADMLDIDYTIDEDGNIRLRKRGKHGAPGKELTDAEKALLLEKLKGGEIPPSLQDIDGDTLEMLEQQLEEELPDIAKIEKRPKPADELYIDIDEDGSIKLKRRGKDGLPGEELTLDEIEKLLQKLKAGEMPPGLEKVDDNTLEKLKRDFENLPVELRDLIEKEVSTEERKRKPCQAVCGIKPKPSPVGKAFDESAKTMETPSSAEILGIDYTIDEDGNIRLLKRGMDGAPGKEMTDVEKAILLDKLEAGKIPPGLQDIDNDTLELLEQQLEDELLVTASDFDHFESIDGTFNSMNYGSGPTIAMIMETPSSTDMLDIDFTIDEDGNIRLLKRGKDGGLEKDLTDAEKSSLLEKLKAGEIPPSLQDIDEDTLEMLEQQLEEELPVTARIEKRLRPADELYIDIDEDGTLKLRRRDNDGIPGEELTLEETEKLLLKLKAGEMPPGLETIDDKTLEKLEQFLELLPVESRDSKKVVSKEERKRKPCKAACATKSKLSPAFDESAKIMETAGSADMLDIDYTMDEDGNIRLLKRGQNGAPGKELTDAEKAILLDKLEAGEIPPSLQEIDKDTLEMLEQQLEEELLVTAEMEEIPESADQLDIYLHEDGRFKLRRLGEELTVEEKHKLLQKLRAGEKPSGLEKLDDETLEKLEQDLADLSVESQELLDMVDSIEEKKRKPCKGICGRAKLKPLAKASDESAEIKEASSSADRLDIDYAIDEDGNIKLQRRGKHGAPTKDLTDAEKLRLLEKLEVGEIPPSLQEIDKNTLKMLEQQLEAEMESELQSTNKLDIQIDEHGKIKLQRLVNDGMPGEELTVEEEERLLQSLKAGEIPFGLENVDEETLEILERYLQELPVDSQDFIKKVESIGKGKNKPCKGICGRAKVQPVEEASDVSGETSKRPSIEDQTGEASGKFATNSSNEFEDAEEESISENERPCKGVCAKFKISTLHQESSTTQASASTDNSLSKDDETSSITKEFLTADEMTTDQSGNQESDESIEERETWETAQKRLVSSRSHPQSSLPCRDICATKEGSEGSSNKFYPRSKSLDESLLKDEDEFETARSKDDATVTKHADHKCKASCRNARERPIMFREETGGIVMGTDQETPHDLVPPGYYLSDDVTPRDLPQWANISTARDSETEKLDLSYNDENGEWLVPEPGEEILQAPNERDAIVDSGWDTQTESEYTEMPDEKVEILESVVPKILSGDIIGPQPTSHLDGRPQNLADAIYQQRMLKNGRLMPNSADNFVTVDERSGIHSDSDVTEGIYEMAVQDTRTSDNAVQRVTSDVNVEAIDIEVRVRSPLVDDLYAAQDLLKEKPLHTDRSTPSKEPDDTHDAFRTGESEIEDTMESAESLSHEEDLDQTGPKTLVDTSKYTLKKNDDKMNLQEAIGSAPEVESTVEDFLDASDFIKSNATVQADSLFVQDQPQQTDINSHENTLNTSAQTKSKPEVATTSMQSDTSHIVYDKAIQYMPLPPEPSKPPRFSSWFASTSGTDNTCKAICNRPVHNNRLPSSGPFIPDYNTRYMESCNIFQKRNVIGKDAQTGRCTCESGIGPTDPSLDNSDGILSRNNRAKQISDCMGIVSTQQTVCSGTYESTDTFHGSQARVNNEETTSCLKDSESKVEYPRALETGDTESKNQKPCYSDCGTLNSRVTTAEQQGLAVYERRRSNKNCAESGSGTCEHKTDEQIQTSQNEDLKYKHTEKKCAKAQVTQLYHCQIQTSMLSVDFNKLHESLERLAVPPKIFSAEMVRNQGITKDEEIQLLIEQLLAKEAYAAEQRKITCAALKQLDNIKSIVEERDCLRKKLENSQFELEKIKKNFDFSYGDVESKDAKDQNLGTMKDSVLPQSCDEEIQSLEHEIKQMREANLPPNQETIVIKKEVEVLKRYCSKFTTIQDENTKLRNLNNDLEAKCAEQSYKLGLIGCREQATIEEIRERMQSLEEAVIERDALQNRVKNLERELSEYHDLPEDVRAFKKRSLLLDDVLKDRDRLAKRVEQMRGLDEELLSFKKKAERVDELDRQLRLATKDAQVAEDELDSMRNKCAMAEIEALNQKSNADTLKCKLVCMEHELESLKSICKEQDILQTEKNRLQMSLDELVRMQDDYEHMCIQMKGLDVLKAERDRYKRRYEDAVGFERECEILRQQLDKAKIIEKEKEALEKQAVDLEKCICEQEDEIKRLVTHIDCLAQKREEQRSKVKVAVSTLKLELEEKESLLSMSEEKLAVMNGKIDTSFKNLSEETSNLRDQKRELEKKIETLTKSNEQLKIDNKTLKENLKIAMSEKDQINSQLTGQINENGCLKCQLDHKDHIIQTLQEVLDDREISKPPIVIASEMHEQEIARLQEELEVAQTENQRLQLSANEEAEKDSAATKQLKSMLENSKKAVERISLELSQQYAEWDKKKYKCCPRCECRGKKKVQDAKIIHCGKCGLKKRVSSPSGQNRSPRKCDTLKKGPGRDTDTPIKKCGCKDTAQYPADAGRLRIPSDSEEDDDQMYTARSAEGNRAKVAELESELLKANNIISDLRNQLDACNGLTAENEALRRHSAEVQDITKDKIKELADTKQQIRNVEADNCCLKFELVNLKKQRTTCDPDSFKKLQNDLEVCLREKENLTRIIEDLKSRQPDDLIDKLVEGGEPSHELEAVNNQLKLQNSDLLKENEYLKKQLEDMSKRMTAAGALQADNDLLAENDQLKQQIANLLSQIDNLKTVSEDAPSSSKVQGDLAENGKLKTQIAELLSQIDKLKKASDDASSLGKALEENENLRRQLEEMNGKMQECATLQADLNNVLAENEKFKKQIAELLSQIDMLKTVSDDTTSSRKALEENEQLKKQLGEMNKKFQESASLQAKLNDLLAENEKLKKQIAELLSQIDELKTVSDHASALGKALEENEHLRKQLQEINKKMQESATSQADLDKVLVENEKLKKEIAELLSQIDKLKTVSDHASALAKALAENEHLRKQLQEMDKKMQEAATLQADMNDLLAENSKLKKDMERLKSKPLESAQETDLHLENSRLSQEIADLKKKIRDLEAQIKDSKEKEKDYSKLQDQIRALTIENDKLKQENAALKREIDNLRKTTVNASLFDKIMGENENLKKQLDDIRKSGKGLDQQQIEKHLKDKETTQATLGDLEDQIKTIISKDKGLSVEAGQDFTQKINDLMKQLSDAQKRADNAEEALRKMKLEDLTAELNSKINSLMNKLADLQKEKDDLKKVLTAANNDKAKLQQDINAILNENRQLQKSMDDKGDRLMGDNVKLRKQIQDLEAEIKSLKNALALAEGGDRKSSDQLNKLMNDNGELQKSLARREGELAKLQKDLEVMQQQTSICAARIQELEQENAKCKKTNSELGTELIKLKSELDDQLDKSKKDAKTISDLQKELAEIKQKLAQIESLNAKLTEETSRLKGDLAQTKVESRLQDEIKKLADKNNTLQTDLDRLKKELQDALNKRDAAEKSKLELDDLKKRLEAENAKLRSKPETDVKENLQDVIDKLKHALVDKENEIAKLKNDVKNAMDDFKRASDELNLLKQNEGRYKDKISQLEKENDKLRKDQNTVLDDLKRINAEMLSDQNNSAKLKQQLSAIESENAKLKKELEKALDDAKRSNGEVASLKDEIAKFKQRIAQLEAENTKLKTELDKARGDLRLSADEFNKAQDDNEKMLQKMRKELADMQEKLNKATGEIKATPDNNLKKLYEDELNKLKQELVNATDNNKNKDQDISRLEQQIKDLKAENNKLVKELELARKAAKDAEAKLGELTKLKDQLSKAEEENGKLQKEKNKLANDVEKSKSDLEKLSDLKDNENRLKQRIAQLEAENAKLKKDLDAALKESKKWKDQLSGLSDENDKLKNKISQIDEENKKLRREVGSTGAESKKGTTDTNELKDANEKLKQRLAQLEKENAKLKSDMDQTLDTTKKSVTDSSKIQDDYNKMKQTLAQLELQNGKLKKDLAQALNEVKSVSSGADDMRRELSKLKERISKLEAENADLKKELNLALDDAKGKANAIKKLQEEINMLKQKLAQMEKGVAKDVPISKETQADNEALRKLREENQKLKDKVNKLENEISKLPKEAGVAASPKDDGEQKQKIDKLENELKRLKNELNQASKGNKSLLDENKDLKDQIAKLKSEIALLKKNAMQLEKMKENEAELKRKIAQLESANVKLRNDLDDATISGQDDQKAASEVRKMKADNKALQDELARLKKMAASSIDPAGRVDDSQKLKDEIAHLKQKLASLQIENAKLQDKYDQSRREAAAQKKDCDDKVAAFKLQLEAFRKEKDKYKSLVDDQKRKSFDIKGKVQEVEQAIVRERKRSKDLENKHSELQTVTSSLEQEVVKERKRSLILQKEKEELGDKLKDTIVNQKELQSKTEDLAKESRKHGEETVKLMKESLVLQTALKDERKRSMDLEKKMESHKEIKEEEVRMLRKESALLQGALREERMRSADLESENKLIKSKLEPIIEKKTRDKLTMVTHGPIAFAPTVIPIFTVPGDAEMSPRKKCLCPGSQDTIMDKAAKHGISSLTLEEMQILNKHLAEATSKILGQSLNVGGHYDYGDKANLLRRIAQLEADLRRKQHHAQQKMTKMQSAVRQEKDKLSTLRRNLEKDKVAPSSCSGSLKKSLDQNTDTLDKMKTKLDKKLDKKLKTKKNSSNTLHPSSLSRASKSPPARDPPSFSSGRRLSSNP